MKKTIICTLVLIISTMSVVKAQSELRGLNVGIGVPVECYDLKAAGMTLHIGGDFAYTVNDKCAVGFYVSGGGGFWVHSSRITNTTNSILCLNCRLD